MVAGDQLDLILKLDRGTFSSVTRSFAPFLVLVAGCAATSFSTMVTLGPTFGTDHQGVVLAVEVAPVLHTAFPTPPPPIRSADGTIAPQLYDPYDGPASAVGIGPMIAVGMDWHSHNLGFSGFTAVGADFLPWLFENGNAVGFGGQLGYARGAYDGFYVIAPRLWFAVPVTEIAGRPVSLGLMLRGQLGFGSGTSGVGPSLVLRL